MHGPLFRKRNNDVVIKVESVTSGYAQISVMTKLPKSWSMPIHEYDTTFVRDYEPIPTGAGVMAVNDRYREPVNADLWDTPERGLQIGQTAAPEAAPIGDVTAVVPGLVTSPIEGDESTVVITGSAPWETTEGLAPVTQ